MLIVKSKESDEEVHDGERHEPDVRRVPGVVIASRSRGDDGGQVFNACSQQGSHGVMFVTNHVLGGHDVAGGLNELDREGSECQRSFVGQLVGVVDEALRKDPVSECSSDQVEDS